MTTTEISWLADDRFRVGDLTFVCTHDYTRATTENEIVLLKRRPFIEFYTSLIERTQPKHLLEIGFFEGGSSLLWAALFPDLRVTSVDIRRERPAIEALAQRFGGRLQFNWETSQDDAAALARIIEARGLPNMIIDDASHQYDLTRRTFEHLYPRLAPGEKYVIEDWGWGHWPGWNMAQWSDVPTMSNLIVELGIAAASTTQWIAYLELDSRACTLTRGAAQGALSLDELWSKRGRDLSLPETRT